MKPPQKRWPDNVEQLRIADLSVATLDQPLMRLIRKIADRNGWTVEEVMVALAERCVAQRELEAKIIPWPNIRRTFTKSDRRKKSSRRGNSRFGKENIQKFPRNLASDFTQYLSRRRNQRCKEQMREANKEG